MADATFLLTAMPDLRADSVADLVARNKCGRVEMRVSVGGGEVDMFKCVCSCVLWTGPGSG